MIQVDNDEQSIVRSQESNKEQRQESNLIDTFKRSKGLGLFAYDHIGGEVYQVEEIFKGDVWLLRDEKGVAYAKRIGHTETYINPKHTHFEALNIKTANNKVDRFRSGATNNLMNLKRPDNKTINLF
jgi:hypothetical protein|tara:strand:- start:556 stop:936 length:381 start_codon:yes stop_codon:yes gene_type:complete